MLHVRRTKVPLRQRSLHTGLLLRMQHGAEEHLGAVRHALRLQHVRLVLQITADRCDHAGEPARCRDGRCLFAIELDLVLLNLVVDGCQVLLWQVAVVIEACVVLEKVLQCHAVLDLRVVRICVEHDDRVG